MGFSSVGAWDNDPLAVEHYRQNVSPNVEKVDLARELPRSLRRQSPALLIAGPPCQGFSTAGLRNLEDERNYLLPLAGDVCARVRPLVAVVENVAAALSGEHARHWRSLEGRLRDAGYRTNTCRVEALNLGMAQRRKRIFLFAWKTGRDTQFAWPKLPQDRLDHVLFGVERQPNHHPRPIPVGTRLYCIAQRIGPGQKLSNVRGGPRSVHSWNIPAVFGKTTAAECAVLEIMMRLRRSERRRDFGDADPVSPKRLDQELKKNTDRLVTSLIRKGYLRRIGKYLDLVHTFNGKCRRFSWEDVACAVDTRFGDPHLFLHPNEHRPFTVREAARLQGFPDSFIFHGPEAGQFRLIGNAVPPPMAQAAAAIGTRLAGL